MTILVDGNTRLLVQGLGREGSYHAGRCREYGTNMVAGVHPNRGGMIFEETVPIFESVHDAVEETGANVGLIFVPAPAAPDAIIEQINEGLPLVICITEGIPVLDMVRVKTYLNSSDTRLVGPNCPGIISPGTNTKIGIMPGAIHSSGRVGVVSRSGTLTYEAVMQLTNLGIGQSTCVGIGGDPVNGTSFVDVLKMFEEDSETDAIVMIGEIGGTREQEAANFISTQMRKPVIASVVGESAPPGKRMGHAGAIITGPAALASEKLSALCDAGAHVTDSPSTIGLKTQEIICG